VNDTGASASGPGTDGTGASASGPGTDDTGASASGPGTDGTGASASGPGTDGTGASASGPGTDGTGASASGPGTDGAGASVPGAAANGPSPWPFSHSDEVRFSDLDMLGHLNNVAFLVFLESARVAYVRTRLPSGEPLIPAGFGVVVAETGISYRSPGQLGERIETLLRPDEVGRSSFRLDFEMRVGERVIADGHSIMVFYDRAAERPAPLPALLRARLLADGARERSRAA